MRNLIGLMVLIVVSSCGKETVHRVRYEVGSSDPSVTVTWTDRHGVHQAPYEADWHALSADVPSGTLVSVTAQNSAATGYVRCAIGIDGKETTTKRSDAANGIVVCTATVP